MITQKLVNRATIAKYKQISKTVFDDKLDELIIEAQIQDVMPLIGERLFNAIMEAPASYSDLLEGGSYEYNGITYQNYGLEAVISYYVYARYALFGSVTDTPFSIVEKMAGQGESKPVEYPFKKAMYQLNRNNAFQIWRNVENYLLRTNEPLFQGCRVVKNNFKIRKIQ